jgi:hypothetical protein
VPSLTKIQTDPDVDRVLTDLRHRLAGNFGITLIGNRLTLRWNLDGQLVDARMIVESVTTPIEGARQGEVRDRLRAVYEKYRRVAPELEDELYHAEYDEWPK